MELAEIEKRFTYHAPGGRQQIRMANLRFEIIALARHMATTCPESRELELAMTHLEQAQFYANAAIARREEPGA